jgi:hypothetical protein
MQQKKKKKKKEKAAYARGREKLLPFVGGTHTTKGTSND